MLQEVTLEGYLQCQALQPGATDQAAVLTSWEWEQAVTTYGKSVFQSVVHIKYANTNQYSPIDMMTMVQVYKCHVNVLH